MLPWERALDVATDKIIAKGHENVRAEHETTFEISRDPWLTPRGDCIIAVNADKAACHLSNAFKKIASSDEAIVIVILTCGNVFDVVVGRGSSRLSFEDCRRLVFRKSSYTSKDTVMIKATKSSKELSRELIKRLKDPNATLTAYLIAVRM